LSTGTKNPATLPDASAPPEGWLPEIAVFVAAVLGRMPTLGAWWNLDDWGQLARSAGLDTGEGLSGWPARWLSQHAYWDLTWPLFGLNSDAHALVRLALHGLAAVLVVRIAWRSGLGPLPRLLAGLVFAASPLAFTPLYWASGIQEILAAVFALAAVERWLAAPTGGRRQLVIASLLAVLSMLSKESGLGLPVLFLVFAWLRIGVRLEDKAFAWGMIMLLLPLAVAEGVLVFNHFGTGAGEPYALGDSLVTLINLGVCGWWLISPGPVLAANVSVAMAVAGGLLLLMWAAWGVLSWRRQKPLALLALVAAVMVLAPALPLKKQLVPYLAYLAVAPLGLLLGSIAQQVKFTRLSHLGLLPGLGFMSLVAMAWGFFGMETRLNNRNEMGMVADPVARATALSWQGCQTMKTLQDHPSLTGTQQNSLSHLTLLQPIVDPQVSALAADLGERWTQPTETYEALGGQLGPRLILGPDVQINWANGLTTASSKAVVLCEAGTSLQFWGRIENALFYAALTDIGLGHFERGRAHMKRAAELNAGETFFIYDEGQMVIPLGLVMQNREAFTDWTLGLLDQGVPRLEVGGLQDLFYNLLITSTGQSLEELTAGSRLLTAPRQPSSQP
jgi:hypothetical protein